MAVIVATHDAEFAAELAPAGRPAGRRPRDRRRPASRRSWRAAGTSPRRPPGSSTARAARCCPAEGAALLHGPARSARVGRVGESGGGSVSWQLASFAIVSPRWPARSGGTSAAARPAKLVAIVATLAALAALGRDAFAAIPDVKPITAIVLVSGVAFGARPGFAVGAIAGLASNVLLGEGPWTPWQMLGWGLVGSRRGAGWDACRVARPSPLVAGPRLRRSPPRLFNLVVDLYTWTGTGSHSLAGLRRGAGHRAGLRPHPRHRQLRLRPGFRGGAAAHAPARPTPPAGELAGPAGAARAQPAPAAASTGCWAVPLAGVLALLCVPALVLGLSACAGATQTTGTAGAPAAASAGRTRGGRARALLPRRRAERRRRLRRRPGAGQQRALLGLGRDRHGRRRQEPPGGASRRAHGARSLRAERGQPAGRRRPRAHDPRPAGLWCLGPFAARWRSGEPAAAPPRLRRLLRRPVQPHGLRRARPSRGGIPRHLADHRRRGPLARPPAGRRRRLRLRRPGAAAATWTTRPPSCRRSPSPGRAGTRRVSRAVGFLARSQNLDGGFPQQSAGTSNAQSTAWAIQALVAAGRAPGAVTRRGSRSPIAYLESLVGADGSVRYSRTGSQTPVWVTAQALTGLAGRPFPIEPVGG